jgi:hypothetical protein
MKAKEETRAGRTLVIFFTRKTPHVVGDDHEGWIERYMQPTLFREFGPRKRLVYYEENGSGTKWHINGTFTRHLKERCRLVFAWEGKYHTNDRDVVPLVRLAKTAERVCLLHHLHVNPQTSRSEESLFSGCRVAGVAEYQHLKGSELYRYVTEGCLGAGTEKQYDRALQYLMKAIPRHAAERIPASLTSIKHDIAHIWLALDVDLQGIAMDAAKAACAGGDGGVGYVTAVMEDVTKSAGWYAAKLAKLRAALVGEGDSYARAAFGLIKGRLADVESIWRLLVELSGMKRKDEKAGWWAREAEVGDEVVNVVPDADSPIARFMVLLDSKLGRKEYIRNDVGEVLDFFANWKGKDGEGWKVKVDGREEVIKDFHKWFCLLDETLDRIRTIITEGGKK